MESWINILAIALIYCGTVFGAGFASGQEIVRFFSDYGVNGIFASFFAAISFCVLGGVVCLRAKEWDMDSAVAYFEKLFPKGLSQILGLLCSAFLVVTFCIMIAGCGTLFAEHFGLRPVLGALLTLILCYFIIKHKVGGLAKLNSVLTPFLFFGVVALCVLCMKGTYPTEEIIQRPLGGALFSSVLYLSYNTVSAVAVLVPAASLARTCTQAALGGALGGVFVGLPLVLMTVVLALSPSWNHAQLPFFSMVCSLHRTLSPLCALLLFGAMLTTAASSGVSVLARVPQRASGRGALALCTAAFFTSLIPFGTLVKTLYTMFGVCGLILLVGIIISIPRK